MCFHKLSSFLPVGGILLLRLLSEGAVLATSVMLILKCLYFLRNEIGFGFLMIVFESVGLVGFDRFFSPSLSLCIILKLWAQRS